MDASIPGLRAIPAANAGPMTGSGNHTYLLLGRVPTLIDAGVGAPAHLDAVDAELGHAGVPLAQVLVTHAHPDHASGAAAVSARWPAAVLRKLPWDGEDRRYGVAWQALGPDEEIPAGDVVLRTVHTPGHAPDHVCFWHQESRTLFGGDLLIAGGSVAIPGTRGGDLRAYLRSLEIVAALNPARILPAHGPAIEDPAPLIRRYSSHRAERERAVLRALATQKRTVPEIVDLVYGELDRRIRPAAEETVHAHLAKLLAEGRVARDGDLYGKVSDT